MIQWLRTKTNPVPLQYETLYLLDTGEIMIGIPSPRDNVVGWSVLNKPDWYFGRKGAYRVRGEDHPKVSLSDQDCELIRELHESGLSYGQIADKFQRSKSTIRDIIKYRTRV